MTFLPGNIRGYFSREIYKKRMEGTGVAGTKRRIPCEKCGAELMEGSMRKHMETQHGVFNLYRPPASTGDKDEKLRTFQARTNQRRKYPCPANCPCPPACDFWELRRAFATYSTPWNARAAAPSRSAGSASCRRRRRR